MSNKIVFTEEEVKILVENINKIPISKLQVMLNKDYYQIMDKLNELGIEYKSSRWTKEEEEILISLADKCYVREIAKVLDRSEDAVISKANRMEINYIKLSREFTEEEIQYIKNNYAKIAITDMARKLKIGRGSIQNQINKLGLKKNNSKNWSDKKINKLKNLSKTKTITELAIIFNTTRSAISTIAYKQGITLIDEKVTWSLDEIELLKKLGKTKTVEEIAIIMDRSTASIRLQINRKNIKVVSNRDLWTEEDDEILKELVNKDKDLFEIIEIMDKIDTTILKKARKLQLEIKYTNRDLTQEEKQNLLNDIRNINIHELVKQYKITSKRIRNLAKKHNVEVNGNKKNWTKEELEKLKELIKEGKTAKEIAQQLNRTEDAIVIKLNRIGFKPINDKNFWTTEEEELLQDLYGMYSIENIAKKLNRTVPALQNKICELGLGSQIDNNYNLIKVQDICDMFNVTPSQVNIIWLALGLNLKKKKITKSTSYFGVTIDDLYDFLEKNQNIWDSRNLEENILGIEPNWLKEKRKRDIENNFVPEKINLKKQQLILAKNFYIEETQDVKVKQKGK